MSKTTVAAILAAFLLAGCASAPSSTESPVPQGTSQAPTEQTTKAAKAGSRANPLPLGASVETKEWQVTVNSVNLSANEAVANANMFNDAPPEGKTFILVNVTATYIGTKADGATPWITIEYVTKSGNSISSSDVFVSPPDAFDSWSTMYEGASTTGNFAFAVPSDSIAEGTLAVNPEMFGDKTFFALV